MKYLQNKYDLSKKVNKKLKKTSKIVSVLKEFKELSKCNVLDIGSGTGIISNTLSKTFKKVYGADVEDYRIIKWGYKFKKIKNDKLPFKNKFFDVVISNQVIEHVNAPEKHLQEINRVLKDDGVVYLATPNKYFPIEPHYYLPFLGILPKNLANFYLKIFKNEDYDVKLLNYKELIDMFKKYFIIKNMIKKIISNPKEYYLEDKFRGLFYLISLLPRSILNYIVPSFVFVLKRK